MMQTIIETFGDDLTCALGLALMFFVVVVVLRGGTASSTHHSPPPQRIHEPYEPDERTRRELARGEAFLAQSNEQRNRAIAEFHNKYGGRFSAWGNDDVVPTVNGEVVDDAPRYSGHYNPDQLQSGKLPGWKLQRDRKHPQLGSGRR